MLDLQLDDTVVVTGCASNIGRGIVHGFAAQGAHLVRANIDEDKAASTRSEALKLGAADRRVVAADLSEPDNAIASSQAALAAVKSRRSGAIAVLLLLVLAPAVGVCEVLYGRVTHVADGDSFTLISTSARRLAVRIAEIDAPEGDQPHGDRSRRMLRDLIADEKIRLVVHTTDQYGRLVGRPYVGELDVGAEMLRAGGAWVYERYLKDPALPALEREAREARRGLWALPEADRRPPWEWRQQGPSAAGRDGSICAIKGNISRSGKRIYHMPGQMHYEATRISGSRGERWFCSEDEARAAGWRPAKQ